MFRVAILVIFSLNQTNNPVVNLLTVVTMSFTILVYFSYTGVYKSQLHNLLEIMSILNLGLFSIATFYGLLTNGKQITIAYISTSVTFILFIIIILYHSVWRILQFKKRIQVLLNNQENHQGKISGCIHGSTDLKNPLLLDVDFVRSS